MGRLTTAVLLLLDFLPFYGVSFEMRNQIKCKQDEDKGKEGRMSSPGGDSNLLCCLPYMAFIIATNVGGKTNCPTQPDAKKRQAHFVQKQIACSCMSQKKKKKDIGMYIHNVEEVMHVLLATATTKLTHKFQLMYINTQTHQNPTLRHKQVLLQ